MALFKVGFLAEISLTNVLKGHPVPITFVYGDSDWVRLTVEDKDAEKLMGSSKDIFIIPSSDHNIHMDNPLALANCIINSLTGKNLPVL